MGSVDWGASSLVEGAAGELSKRRVDGCTLPSHIWVLILASRLPNLTTILSLRATRLLTHKLIIEPLTFMNITGFWLHILTLPMLFMIQERTDIVVTVRVDKSTIAIHLVVFDLAFVDRTIVDDVTANTLDVPILI